jgi:serine/threonine-protein kinase
MTATLTQAQVSIDAEVERIGESLIYASQQLSTVGITGDQAHSILRALAANSSFIINAGTQNLQNTMVAAEPANWSFIEGRNVGEQTYLNPNPHCDITPVMSPIVPLVSDVMGNILAAPIFNADKEIIGYVSVVFDPQTLIRGAVSSAAAEKPYELVGLQLDGLIMYDSDPTQQWKYLFTDSAYANYTSLLSLGRQMVTSSSGYGTYTYNLIGSVEVAQKECYWTTIAAYGQEWRLIIIHAT